MKNEQSYLIAVFGKVCSGKNQYVLENYPPNCLHIDIGDVVRELTKTQSRTHDKSLDSQIIDYLQNEIFYSKADTDTIVITGIRQLSILNALENIVNEIYTINYERVLLNVPEPILKVRYEKRAATKDHSISFEDTIKRDDLLGYGELEKYLYTVKTTIVQNYSTLEYKNLTIVSKNCTQNEIDTL